MNSPAFPFKISSASLAVSRDSSRGLKRQSRIPTVKTLSLPPSDIGDGIYLGVLPALVDSGACVSTIIFDLVAPLHTQLAPWAGPQLVGFSDEEAIPLGALTLDVKFGIESHKIAVAVLKKAPFPFVLSTGWMCKARPTFKYVDNKIEVHPVELRTMDQRQPPVLSPSPLLRTP